MIAAVTLLALGALLSPLAAQPVSPEAGGATSTSQAEAPDVSAASLERRIHEQVNAARERQGLSPLRFDEALADIAREHSAAMAEQGFFAHVDPIGQDPTARGLEAGYRCRKERGRYVTEGIAENLYQHNLYDSARQRLVGGEVVDVTYDWNTEAEIARTTVEGWLGSEEHRRNVLGTGFDREGIGVLITDDDRVYITQNLC